jgi:hypothetical protein
MDKFGEERVVDVSVDEEYEVDQCLGIHFVVGGSRFRLLSPRWVSLVWLSVPLFLVSDLSASSVSAGVVSWDRRTRGDREV